VGAITEPLIPALLKPLLDQGFTEGSLELWMVPAAIMGVFVVRGLAQFVGQYALARIANEGMLTLRTALFNRLLAADMGLFTRQSASSLSNTVVYEVQTGATLLVQALLGISRDGFTLVALLGYLLYLNWQLTLIVAVVVPGVAWIMKTLSRRLYHLTKSGQQATDELAYVVEENVLAHRMVRLQGQWRADLTVFLDNRQMGGRPGLFVMTPLQLRNSQTLVMVQRGWVPRNFLDRGQLPRVATPDGEVALVARVAPPPSKLYEFKGGDNGVLRQNLDLPEFARETGVAVLTRISVIETAAASDGLARDWPAFSTGVDKHYGYAFQWFGLSALVAILYVWFQFIRPRRAAKRG